MSNKATFLLGFVIIILLATQYFFSPPSQSPYVKYVRSGEEKGEADGSRMKPYLNLQNAIDNCDDGDTLIVLPGLYTIEPEFFVEELCGNCQEHRTQVIATRGLLIENKRIAIKGSGAGKTFVETNAGYGVLFLNSRGSTIESLTITGGKRDIGGDATDAGIVLKFSTVTVKNCNISDNSDRKEDVVVGIGGIMVREGSELTAIGNTIENNSWDGIALYRGAIAYIEDNLIGKGRGAGIGVTWDACATILRNQIYEYWKGIGSFGDSRVIVRNNIVRDCLGWGIVATGTSYMDAANNVVYHNGNCGMAAWSEDASGRFTNNIVAKNGWKEQWVAPRVGIQNYGGIENFIVSHNNVWGNEAGDYGDMKSLTGKNGNISADPLFVDAAAGNFTLQKRSPCIDNGNPMIYDSDGTVSDMGTYSGPGNSMTIIHFQDKSDQTEIEN